MRFTYICCHLTWSQSLVATSCGNLSEFMCFLPSRSSRSFCIMGPTSRVAAIIVLERREINKSYGT